MLTLANKTIQFHSNFTKYTLSLSMETSYSTGLSEQFSLLQGAISSPSMGLSRDMKVRNSKTVEGFHQLTFVSKIERAPTLGQHTYAYTYTYTYTTERENGTSRPTASQAPRHRLAVPPPPDRETNPSDGIADEKGPQDRAPRVVPGRQEQRGPHHLQPAVVAPSVYHTPFKFLPRSDPRRQANLTQIIRASSSSSSSTTSTVTAPELGTQANGGFVPPKQNVTREQVEEMRALRALDPTKWSVAALATKYDCTNWFVMMCCKASPEHKASEQARLEAIKARWGPIRTKAREERQKRKAMLGRSEL
ncbi:hypothetical protein G7054_g13157 [Neopestalotiopsis clavispora]|nr:hypothetical protein G7054_g13157 [Neopestalotiopsis clavispora]